MHSKPRNTKKRVEPANAITPIVVIIEATDALAMGHRFKKEDRVIEDEEGVWLLRKLDNVTRENLKAMCVSGIATWGVQP